MLIDHVTNLKMNAWCKLEVRMASWFGEIPACEIVWILKHGIRQGHGTCQCHALIGIWWWVEHVSELNIISIRLSLLKWHPMMQKSISEIVYNKTKEIFRLFIEE